MKRSKEETNMIIQNAHDILDNNEILTLSDINQLEINIKEVKDFFNNTQISEDKDIREKSYNDAIEMLKKHGSFVNELKYMFKLHNTQYDFLKKYLIKNGEYGREYIQYFSDVFNNFFCKYDTAISLTKPYVKHTSLFKETENEIFNLSNDEIIKISTLLSLVKVNGSNIIDITIFQSIMTEIIKISTIVEYIKYEHETLIEIFQEWTKGFEKYDTEELNGE